MKPKLSDRRVAFELQTIFYNFTYITFQLKL